MTNGPDPGARLCRIVIVGDGPAAWIAAAALGKTLRTVDYSIRVVATRNGDGTPLLADADATWPLPDAVLQALLPGEDAVIHATGGAFTLGVAFAGWAAPGETRFHPFGSTGAGLGPVPFHHLALRLRASGRGLRFADYALAALAAQAGRFARPERDPGSVLSTLRYGLHLDCRKLAGLLRPSAESAGVRRVEGVLEQVEPAADGGVAALSTSTGERIDADLFLDCSGADATLAGQGPDSSWRDWSDRLPCDRLARVTLADAGAPPPYSIAQAHRAGWIRQLPLQGRTVLTFFHGSGLLSEDEALDVLRRAAGSPSPADIACSAVRFGRRAAPWRGNCVALGQAAAAIDPLAASNLHLVLLGVYRLLRLLPRETRYEAVAREYNRQLVAIFDHARDFASLRYKLNGRRGEAMWDACRAMPLPESLAYRLELYEARARVPMYDEEPFEETDWIDLFDSMNIRPRRYSPSADGFPLAEIESHFGRARAVMLDALRRMPAHAEYLARTGERAGSSPRG